MRVEEAEDRGVDNSCCGDASVGDACGGERTDVGVRPSWRISATSLAVDSVSAMNDADGRHCLLLLLLDGVPSSPSSSCASAFASANAETEEEEDEEEEEGDEDDDDEDETAEEVVTAAVAAAGMAIGAVEEAKWVGPRGTVLIEESEDTDRDDEEEEEEDAGTLRPCVKGK